MVPPVMQPGERDYLRGTDFTWTFVNRVQPLDPTCIGRPYQAQAAVGVVHGGHHRQGGHAGGHPGRNGPFAEQVPADETEQHAHRHTRTFRTRGG